MYVPKSGYKIRIQFKAESTYFVNVTWQFSSLEMYKPKELCWVEGTEGFHIAGLKCMEMSDVCGREMTVHVDYKFSETHRKELSVVMKTHLLHAPCSKKTQHTNTWICKMHKLRRHFGHSYSSRSSPCLTMSSRREGRFWKEPHQSEKACSKLLLVFRRLG